jgi:endonuclease/exonuclease/phosphatase family metal-dependent hydrolase
MWSLRSFHDRYLRRISRRDYPYKILVEGNDPRGINVALISRYMINSSTTHQHIFKDIQYADGTRRERVFRRDCLEVDLKKDNKTLPIFVCHFKSMSGGRDTTRPIRLAEATTVREILEDRFGDPSTHDWVIAGDLNDYTETDGTPDQNHGLDPLLSNGFSFNLVKNIQDPRNRWTHYYSEDDSYHQLDYILVSPSLREKNPDLEPKIIRKGQSYRAERYSGERWPRVGYERPKASDHCPVVVELNY